MKYLVAVLCLAQIVLAAPAEKTVVEQAQENFATIQKQATEAVQDANTKFLEITGTKTNVNLLNTIEQNANTYGTQVQGLAKQISDQISANKAQTDSIFSSVLSQIAESAKAILADGDQAKANQLQQGYSNVLTQTNTLRAQIEEQGGVAGNALLETVQKLYKQTLESAKTVAQQLDAAKQQ